MTTYDVVVVGGRVAGASTALLLARAGVRVAVVERTAPGRDTVSTHALMRAGVLQLTKWGILDSVVAAGTPPVRHTTFSYPDGEQTQVSIRAGHGVEALFAPRRTLLDRLLLDAAADAGADVISRATVLGLERDAGRRIRGVTAQSTPGSSYRLEADLTVGADGLRSVVAQQVGAPVVRQGRSASAVLYRYVRGLGTTGYEWVYGRRAGAGLIPTNDGETCVFASTTPAVMRRLRRLGSEETYLHLLEESRPGLAARIRGGTGWSRMRGWRGTPGHVRRPFGPGWALVGDAAYYKDPITAHGITDALRDAELLADAAVVTLGGGPDAGSALPAYQETRDRLSRQLWDVTEEVATYAWDADRARTLLRAVSASMSDEVDHLAGLPRAAPPELAGSALARPDNQAVRR
ncbi:MAG: FAD-dependent monooxygenase [Nocardioides sp.]|nr:FAD-dependent monooxygenase [Nocardioides sp.]